MEYLKDVKGLSDNEPVSDLCKITPKWLTVSDNIHDTPFTLILEREIHYNLSTITLSFTVDLTLWHELNPISSFQSIFFTNPFWPTSVHFYISSWKVRLLCVLRFRYSTRSRIHNYSVFLSDTPTRYPFLFSFLFFLLQTSDSLSLFRLRTCRNIGYHSSNFK